MNYKNKIKLHIDLDKDDQSYLWMSKQSDKVGARGHIGTHLDSYTKEPEKKYYELDAEIIDFSCDVLEKEIKNKELEGKAVIIYTANSYENKYGSKEYNSKNTCLKIEDLKYILSKKPNFIIIDSYGIGKHGKEHVMFDKLCEENNCFVVENVFISPDIVDLIDVITIDIDILIKSTGKPCKIYAYKK